MPSEKETQQQRHQQKIWSNFHHILWYIACFCCGCWWCFCFCFALFSQRNVNDKVDKYLILVFVIPNMVVCVCSSSSNCVHIKITYCRYAWKKNHTQTKQNQTSPFVSYRFHLLRFFCTFLLSLSLNHSLFLLFSSDMLKSCWFHPYTWRFYIFMIHPSELEASQ